MSPLKVSYKDPAELRRRDRNPRTHTPNQTKQIAASIKELDFINPVLIDGSNGIIAGHGRVAAAKLLGMGDIPTVRVDHLTPAQVRAELKRRSAIEPLIGHLKAEGHLGRCYLKGRDGDAANAVLTAAGY